MLPTSQCFWAVTDKKKLQTRGENATIKMENIFCFCGFFDIFPPLSLSRQLPVYNALVKEGREIRFRLNALRQEEVELQEKYYPHALKLPNRIHPDVVRSVK